MRKFILMVLLFFAVIAIVDRAFGIAMKNVLQDTDKGDWGRNDFIFNEVKSDVIILGSSRAIHHYDPQIFSDSLRMSCYNCGEDGMGIFLMWARYQAIRERSIPKLVIYEVLPEFDLLKNKDDLKYLKFLRPYSTEPVVSSMIDDISSREQIKLFSEMYRYNSVFVDIVAQYVSKSPGTARDYTWSPLMGNMNYSPRKAKELQQMVQVDSLKMTYMEDLILQCKEDGTQLFFVASPIYQPMSDNEFLPLKDLCRQYKIPFINHYCDSDYCDNLTCFVDASHLNTKGAEMFTVLVASEIKDVIRKKGNGVQ